MSVIRMPRFLRGAPAPQTQPADAWDAEIEAMRGVGEWLSQLDEKSQARVLTYWWWRIRDGKSPIIDKWVEATAEECADDVLLTKGDFGKLPVAGGGS